MKCVANSQDKILSKDNLNQTYLQVVRNKGASRSDEMTVEEAKQLFKYIL